jgi:hypothetical protein
MPKIIYFFPVVVMLLFISPFIYDALRVQLGMVTCGRFFFQCKESWERQYNTFGQQVTVHFRVNWKGERLINLPKLSCEYDGTPQEYRKLIEQIPNMQLVMENDTYFIYADNDHGQLILDKKDKPYVSGLERSEYYNRVLTKLMYKGTECEK